MKTDKEIVEELRKENNELKKQNGYLREEVASAHQFRVNLYNEWSELTTRALSSCRLYEKRLKKMEIRLSKKDR